MNARARASVVCVHEDKILLVLARDEFVPRDYLFLPGGGIEPGEGPAQAAIRETMEETGYAVEVLESQATTADYDFPWQGNLVASHTTFFRAYLVDPAKKPAPVAADPFVLETRWEPLAELERIINYHPVILSHVKRQLENGI